MSGLAAGLWARRRHPVTDADTATALGSGDVAVLATPRLLAWMEAATTVAIADELTPGRTTVGTRVEVDHLAASPVGAVVWVRADLLAVDGRALTFAVTAEDGSGRRVGEGRVVRAIVDRERFLDRAAQLL